MDVNVQVRGLNQAIARLKDMGKRMQDIRPVSRDILLAVQADVDRRFSQSPPTETGGNVWGGEYWPHLTEEYLSSNPRRVGGQLLRDTGELQQSFGVGQVGNIAIARPQEIVFGSSLPKARGLAKKRPLVFAHPVLLEDIGSIVEFHLARAFA